MRFFTLLALVITVGSISCASADKQDDPKESKTLRVMTYNIHHALGMDDEVDIERIAAVIAAEDPDVVALQEVDFKTTRVKGSDQPAELARLTGMKVHYAPAFDLLGGQYGQAVLSKAPIKAVQVVQLPRLKDEQRIAIVATIGHPSGDFRFVATHLTHNNEAERVGQVNGLLSALASMDPMPTILAGDLNAVPGSPPIQRLLETFEDTTGATSLTHPTEEPRIKIDWVVLGKESPWTVTSAKVVEESVASDHRPVVVELKKER